MNRRRTNLELLAVHGGDISLLADGKGVGHSLSGGLGGDDKVIAALLDLANWLDVLGHLDHIGWKLWKRRGRVSDTALSLTQERNQDCQTVSPAWFNIRKHHCIIWTEE